MKKRLYTFIGLVAISMMVLPSCKKDFTEINTDPNNSPTSTPAQLLAPALVSTVTANMVRNRNFNNELMQVTVSLSDADAQVFRYEYRRTYADYLWNSWYVQLTNFKDIYTKAGEPLTANKSYQGIALICQAWIYSMITDAYGDAPYSESNQAKNGITEPKFDTQKEIYLDLFKKLEEANTLLSTGPAVLASSDPIYAGNVSKWRKFGNSLYLRMLLRLSGKAEVSSDMIAKIKEMVDTKASTYPKMTSNDDSAILRWVGTGPYTNPYVTNVRTQDFTAPSIGSFFIDHLRDWQHPCLDITKYGKGGVNRWGIAQGSNGFVGVPGGYLPGAGVAKQAYFYSSASTVSSALVTNLQVEPLDGLILTYGELNFILSEAALKGFITTGTAENYYKTGILSTITTWLPIWPNLTSTTTPTTPATITDAAFLTYLTNADIIWSPAGSVDDHMEEIHLQKYYTLFLEDLQQWIEFRRTGHPVLPKGAGLKNGGVMPARLTYPVYVQSANPTNYKKAVEVQGADEIYTQVWWQKP
ncbi:SusD/RagB family nutrient-binding outer membrane lipoprotein [Pedobacter psychrodurus]|uniref:SusD/RagB family nutrient-binding outer membrane lipoprotein n=1 Tax=Pedobacter psychrodurus TaxID=2530456 RepID=UPI0029311069|nr:SusD/RagB family nutrient-binding outer membrane lipoprotein [Pedobacter psychrodurus]